MGKVYSTCCQAITIRHQRYRPSQQIIKPIPFSEKGSEKQKGNDIPQNMFQQKKDQKIKQISTLTQIVAKTNNKIDDEMSMLPLTSNIKNLTQNINAQIVANQQHVTNTQINQQNSQIIEVPYEVIKLIIKPQMLNYLLKVQNSLNKIFIERTSPNYHSWKLQKEGFYSNKLIDSRTIIFNDKNCYLGFTKYKDQFIPEGYGILITTVDYYEGQFKNGKAHGEGKYIDFASKIKIEAKRWENGNLKEGRLVGNTFLNKKPLQNQHLKNSKAQHHHPKQTKDEPKYFQYKGNFDKNIPHGYGQLKVYTSSKLNAIAYVYKGNFKEGKYQDSKGYYQCNDYIYKGAFKEGKKHGSGELQQILDKNYAKTTKKRNVIFDNDKILKKIEQK